ncbi:carboxypeptidase-like regulatory domain-containing protein [Chryseosolibacter indicus]|uniref:Carboxypeptidase-like regulatory domain-containing protein n=1 Tax=Chryseosolibacter indicus TaxID=2782351 RepID=A0ABS5VR97_9BACT|nr:carboxypeptidase-like regulatory domain-containing protein [Chryseosolibacter indicus]
MKFFISKPLFIAIVAVLGSVLFFSNASAQQQKRIIQLSGVVMDTVEGPLPGVHVYVPKAGRGVTTNSVGFFSMPVLAGDSIVISSVGYQRQHYIVPAGTAEYLTIIVPMVQDVTYLREVEIVPYPTEEVFKEAVLALNLPQDNGIDAKSMNQELLALILKTTPMDGPQNQKYYLNQWAASQNDKFMPVTNPFLNPFNWVKFFNGLKNNKKK